MPFPFDNTYSRLPDAFFEPVEPTPVSAPQLILRNDALAAELGIAPDDLTVGILSGNQIPEGATPLAMAYSGHQFGGFSPQLGDGRAILLGEVIDSSGVRRDIQLKGPGPTPFSRRGDGRSALGPVLREYIVSEAMHALGVPTTRALAAVTSGDRVRRETMQAGGVFTRVAQSHIRVGTFQWFAARQDFENLKILADYVIDRHYPECKQDENPYRALLVNVIKRQAELIGHWMQLGFIHGVMNTDNCSVVGDTIDYGPCAFMDDYDPLKKFSSIDQQGRYAFENQAPIAQWNLTRFAETLLPLLADDQAKAIEFAEEHLNAFPDMFQAALSLRLAAKIGIASPNDDDWTMVEALLTTMADDDADFTLTFRHLSAALGRTPIEDALHSQFKNTEAISGWLDRWRTRMQAIVPNEAFALMRRSNPIFIPRNHRVEEVIAAGYEGNFAPFHKLHAVLKNPFTEQPENAEFENAPTPDEVVCATFCGT